LHEEERRSDVHRHHALEGLGADLGEGHVLVGGGVVHDEVDGAVGLANAAREVRDGAHVGEIAGLDAHAAPERLELSGHLVHGLPGPVRVHDEVVPCSREGRRESRAPRGRLPP
jgi:hypothetical protein